MNFNQVPTKLHPSQINNMSQRLPQNFGGKFKNVPKTNRNIIAGQKAWSSGQRPHNPLNRIAGNFAQGPKPNISNNIPTPASGISPPKPDEKAVAKNEKDMHRYATEDWYLQVDNKGTNNATEGTKDVINSLAEEDDDGFLLQLAKKESSNSDKIDSNLAGLDFTSNNLKSPKNFNQNYGSRSNNSDAHSPKNQMNSSNYDMKKQFDSEMEQLKEFKRKMEEEKRKFEEQQKEFQQIKYAEQMRLREHSKRIQEKEEEIIKMQKLNVQRKTIYEKIEKDKKEEEEKVISKKTIEDHYLLNITELKIEKMIGSGGSAKVYKGTYKEIDVAIKRLNLQSIDISKARQEFKREVNTLSKIRNPNLVLFMGVALDNTNLCIVTEY